MRDTCQLPPTATSPYVAVAVADHVNDHVNVDVTSTSTSTFRGNRALN